MRRNYWLDRLIYREDGTKRAIVTIMLVLVNVIVWCVMELFGNTLNAAFIAAHGGIYPDLVLTDGGWYRLFTAMFLHFGIQHLANNMIILAATGDKLEKAVGSMRYLVIYLGAGLAGNVLSLYQMLHKGEYAVSAGASGSVFGVIGALLWVAVCNRGRFEGLTIKGLLFMIALCLYYGITTTGIDNWAHLGGAAAGFLLCILCYRRADCAEDRFYSD